MTRFPGDASFTLWLAVIAGIAVAIYGAVEWLFGSAQIATGS